MKRSQSVTRRDLFRGLRRPETPAWLGEPSPVRAPAQETLQESLPEQPRSADDEPYQLPPVRQAMLNDTELAALFHDLEHSATDVQLNRQMTASNAPDDRTDSASHLQAAHRALRNGDLSRVQIRYRWQNALWIDTLQRIGR